MPTRLPTQTLTLSKRTARRFMLAHQGLWPPRRLKGKPGVMDFIRRVGCIQFDPINLVGRNPDLVLQSRVAGYRPRMLESLLYKDRALLDGWDKVMSIYPVEDWPHFERHRERMRYHHLQDSNPVVKVIPKVRRLIEETGPVSSLEFDGDHKVDWAWGPTKIARAALETMYATGELVVHHKVNTRRYYDLAHRHLPPDLLAAPDPNATLDDYYDWHVLRRIGGLGLASPRATECWLGILRQKSVERIPSFLRLTDQSRIVPLTVEGADNRPYFIRASDLERLEAIQNSRAPKAQAAFIAPLDNFLWDRATISAIFDFDYTWEVYKPAAQRQYGYYVLPVLYGDRFVARWEPAFDKKTGELEIANWWWEPGVQPDEPMEAALSRAMLEFARYLSAKTLRLAPAIKRRKDLKWVDG